MELTFPFKNICIHNLIRFVDPYQILDFIEYKDGGDINKIFETYIGIYESGLPNFESELLQVINTTDQATIDAYFRMLADDMSYIKDTVSIENINALVEKFNVNALDHFEKEVESETNKYFEMEDRKRAHLEEYEDYSNLGLLFHRPLEKEKRINYNFYCIEKNLPHINSGYTGQFHEFLLELSERFMTIAVKYGKDWYQGKIVSGVKSHVKPILFVEGELDIDYLTKAAEHLGEQRLLAKVDIRQRGGFKNLDKLWEIFKSDSWETIAQKKIFLYDCDTEKINEDNLHNYKRIIPTQVNNPIKKGIENLFKEDLIKRAIAQKSALVDVICSHGTKRGEQYQSVGYQIDRQEKRNFCDWVCVHGTKDDFGHFDIIFSIIKEIVEKEA